MPLLVRLFLPPKEPGKPVTDETWYLDTSALDKDAFLDSSQHSGG